MGDSKQEEIFLSGKGFKMMLAVTYNINRILEYLGNSRKPQGAGMTCRRKCLKVVLASFLFGVEKQGKE